MIRYKNVEYKTLKDPLPIIETPDHKLAKKVYIGDKEVYPVAMSTTLVDGRKFCEIIKTLANGGNQTYSSNDNKITAIKYSEQLPSDFVPSNANTVSTNDSRYEIYAYYNNDDSTIYLYTEAETIYTNRDCSYMFCYCRSLTDISALSNWDVSNVTNMDSMFEYCGLLIDIDALSSWDVSSVTNMSNMFYYCSSLTDIDALSSWDVSSVTNMSGMFRDCRLLTNIDALLNWDVPSVANISYMFTSCHSLTNIDALLNWDVSNVANMSYMFYFCRSLTDIDALSSWDVSSVTNMSNMFYYCTSLRNLDGIINWSVNKSGRYTYMLYSVPADYRTILSSWDGTWNSYGTFTPNAA